MLSFVFFKYIEILNQTTFENCRKQCKKLPGLHDLELLDSPKLNETFFVDINYSFEAKNWFWVSDSTKIGYLKLKFSNS